jgi:hypothetical protein
MSSKVQNLKQIQVCFLLGNENQNVEQFSKHSDLKANKWVPEREEYRQVLDRSK